MGIIAKQSFYNFISIGLAFLLGAINTLYLYPTFLGSTRQGLVVAILALSNLLQPFLSFGVQHAIIKFYSSFEDKKDRDALLNFSIFSPLLVVALVSAFFWFNYDLVVQFVAASNSGMGEYAFLILLVAIATAYFEIFFSWLRVHLHSVFGNFLKEFYPRLLLFGLLTCYALEFLNFNEFMLALLVGYYLRLLIVIGYSFKIYSPQIRFDLPKNFKFILTYSLWILMSGMAASFILDIDKSMLSNLVAMENVAYYSVALFIATVVEAPGRAMFQIVSPLVAKAINKNDKMALEQLLKKSSRNLLVVCSFIFLIINLNLEDFYALVNKPGYDSAILVVTIVSVGKLFSMSLGCLNNIIGNSKHFRYIMFFSIIAALMAVGLNMLWIPSMGLIGAAYATLVVIMFTNVLKIILIYKYFKMHPFEWHTIKILLLVLGLYIIFGVFEIELAPIWAIVLRSIAITVLFSSVAYFWGLTDDIKFVAKKFLK